MQKKGFTLIELLIVVGILAVLATVVVLVLNPAELFKQARDARRVEDLNSVRGAINLYLATVAQPEMDEGGGTCGTQFWGTISTATENFSGSPSIDGSTGTGVDGTGWVPIHFGSTTGGAPLSVLPTDPLNPDTAAQSYTYQCNDTLKTFEVNANMESTRYASSGADDVESTDGGSVVSIYEVGNDPGLDL